ncbi:hypothetical protein HPB52_020510 [Rhipicephalus sanguineus]|uniref:Sodium-coupled monocarboxylate transporter 1 n=1 Tax=Rhipicephalus sanguineus TaxID=34632 RepID=A0A9D4T1L0_RHISA|nr:hypothetical protein HPB52_020510 [Rhipicephalus sanguineus]
MDNVTLRSSAALVARFTPYDYAVFVCALLGSGAIGLYQAFAGGSGGSQSLQEMLTGGGQLPTVPVGTSLMASFISAAYLLGNASEIYTDGTMYFMVFLSYFLVIPVTAHLYMPVYYNLNVCTAYEYLELRFNRPIRFIAVAMFTVQMGGIKAVVYTDTFQCVVMFIAFIVVVSMGFQEVGGFENAWNIAKQGRRVVFNSVSSKLNVRHTIWGLIIGAWFTNSASYTTNQMMVLRYLTVKTLTRAKIVVWLNLPYLCLILLLSCLSGLMIYARYATCDPLLTKRIDTTDQLLPYFVMDVLADTTGVAGVFVTGIFMASLSSVSSGINALATVFYVDVIAILRPGIKESTGSYIMVALGVFFGILSIALVAVAEQLGDVLAAQSAINSGLGGPLLGLFSMGVFIPHVSSKGAMLGLLTSLGISLWISIGSLVNSPTYPSPPLSVDGCPALYRNVTNSSEPYIHPIITEDSSTSTKTRPHNASPPESYDNSIHTNEPTEPSQARTGSLATQQRRHELFDSEPSCRLCGAAEETVTHVLQDCPRLHDKPRTSPSLPELLGLSGQIEENHFDRVNYTKDLLLRWDRLNREVATTSARETPHTPFSAAPRTDTPPPCGNGSKQTDEKLAGPVMLQDPSRKQWLRQSTSITELPNTAAG